uniref:PepSY-associated TM helix domain-containing protein n=1 Tax=Shinella sumterensis TaxID=1967501 RepID=UPI003F846604
VPLSDITHASMNHGGIKQVPWTLEQTPMPASGSDAGVAGTPEGEPVTIDAVVALARKLGFDQRFQLAFPNGETGVWTIARDTMSNDSSDPLSDRTVHVDQYTGKVLADVGFADYGLPGKAMAVGIAFHEGDMGLWNLALNTLFCLSIVFLSASGVVMWWKRRPKGAVRLFAPNISEPGPLWKTGAVVMLAVSLLFPLTGAVLVTVLFLDLLVIRNIRPLKKALS